jgi:hypothetical protein
VGFFFARNFVAKVQSLAACIMACLAMKPETA